MLKWKTILERWRCAEWVKGGSTCSYTLRGVNFWAHNAQWLYHSDGGYGPSFSVIHGQL